MKVSSERRIMDSMRRVVRALRASPPAALPPAQLFVLQQLLDHSAGSVNELAARTHTDQSSVSAIIGKLVRRGLAKRVPDPADRRRQRVAATPKGRTVARRAPSVPGRLVSALAALPPGDRRTLGDLLERWVEAAGLAQETPALFMERERK